MKTEEEIQNIIILQSESIEVCLKKLNDSRIFMKKT